MQARDFVYWLQGFFEISGNKEITAEQTAIIRNHLNMVFHHEIDPAMGDQKHQEDLTAIHQGGTPPSKDPKSQGPDSPKAVSGQASIATSSLDADLRDGPVRYNC